MTPVDDWLATARNALADESGLGAADLELDEDAVATILDLARIAAHCSGARTNAPLLCYLVGLARREGAGLHALAEAVRRSSS